jgi:hypothetical protein
VVDNSDNAAFQDQISDDDIALAIPGAGPQAAEQGHSDTSYEGDDGNK